jgi:hypothetical protein
MQPGRPAWRQPRNWRLAPDREDDSITLRESGWPFREPMPVWGRWQQAARLSKISSAFLCQTEGFGSSFQSVIQVRIAATRSRTERWAFRLIHFVVNSANRRSTRFNQELWVGVEWSVKRGLRTSQRWIDGVLWVDELSSTTCTSRSSGTGASIRLRKRRNPAAR